MSLPICVTYIVKVDHNRVPSYKKLDLYNVVTGDEKLCAVKIEQNPSLHQHPPA